MPQDHQENQCLQMQFRLSFDPPRSLCLTPKDYPVGPNFAEIHHANHLFWQFLQENQFPIF